MEQIPPIEMRYLRYFVGVAEKLSYRQAAKCLHVSAPALSVQIKNLETLLDVRLFERDTAQVRLTPPGEVLMREARKIFAIMEDLVRTTRKAAQGDHTRLRVGMPGQFGGSFIPEVLNTYRKRYPGVDVTLLDLGVNEEQLKALEEGRTHVGFLYGFQPPRIKGMGFLLTIDMPMRAVMGARHPMASARQVTLAELATYPLLAIEGYDPQTRDLLDVFRKRKLAPRIFKKADSFNACIAMLIAGEGVAVLPEMRVMALNPGLAMRPIRDATPGMRLQLHAIWKKNVAPVQALNFVDVLRKAGVQHD